MINRIQILYKDGIPDTRGRKIAREAQNFLGIETGKIKSTKIYIINYDLTLDQVNQLAENGLCDKVLHNIMLNELLQPAGFYSFILAAKLPGVTDDEGISAQNTLSDLLGLTLDIRTQHIFSQELLYLEKNLSSSELQKIAETLLGNKLINHFEYGLLPVEALYLPEVKILQAKFRETIDLDVDDEALLEISRSRLLSLNLAEMQAIRDYFQQPEVRINRRHRGINRKVTDCELEVLAQTWSEHCKHKEFGALIHYENEQTGEVLEIDSLFQTYIKGSTEIISRRLEAAGNNWLKLVFTDNAGVVQVNKEQVLVWKVETHNSPSAIDPYGGAITGILGNNRDPLATGIGGAQLLFNTNVLCFGPPDYKKELLPGQLHPRRIFSGVREGIEDGGNKSGIPTVNGSIIFDERYSGKPLVYCGTGGLMPLKYGNRPSWEKKIDAGDLIFMAGGRVGKDGIHGATFSSAEIDENSPQSAVQIGSPITQKLLSDFMQEAVGKNLIKCSTDNGAGGLSSSIGELAQISGGAIINLEKVPLKYANLEPWEIYISESQERMTFVIEGSKVKELRKLAERRDVELTEVGVFTSDGYIDVRYDDKCVAWLNIEFLHNGYPRKKMEAAWQKQYLREPELINDEDYNVTLKRLLASWNICSRESVIRQYDHEVKGKTIIKPLMGRQGKTPQDAAVMRLDHESWQGIAISNGICPKYGDIDAYQMSAGAFDEGIRQIISAGGRLPDPDDKTAPFWSVNDNFCVPDSSYDEISNPDGKLKLAKLVQMNQALYDMSTWYNIPMTSGKDSMKNDFKAGDIKISVPPTILYSMVAGIDDIRNTITSDFKQAGNLIYLVGKTRNELGGSEYYRLYGEIGANVPRVFRETGLRIYKKMMAANVAKLIVSSHDISDGGLAVCVAECLFGTGFGADIRLSEDKLSKAALLFSETHSRFVVSIKTESREEFRKVFGSDASLLGEVTTEEYLKISVNNEQLITTAVEELLTSWSSSLQEI
ncbi:MAG: phosphoribosylformylglycinamidine synthase [Candidatus Cloacimonetes bacterium]|nr:phosphoribosylformylglycinamidine synthase [Candidatus Cloacimonadota bacterium]